MLNHISIGVASLPRAKAFYDAILATLGYRCLSADASSLGYGEEAIEFWVLTAEKPVPYRVEAYCSSGGSKQADQATPRDAAGH